MTSIDHDALKRFQHCWSSRDQTGIGLAFIAERSRDNVGQALSQVEPGSFVIAVDGAEWFSGRAVVALHIFAASSPRSRCVLSCCHATLPRRKSCSYPA